MAKKRGYKKIGEQLGGGSVGEKHAGRDTEELRRRFLEFRREHRNRTRIPEVLRDAALATIQRGIPADEVRRACLISEGQLTRWIECRHSFTKTPETRDASTARVFPVVEDTVGNAALRGVETDSSALHLRVGRWDICIRQDER
jgi:hypothetical protein